MRSLMTILAIFGLSLGMLATTAIAGGWAVTTFDDLPGQFVSGKEYLLGYTIRQHGETPVNVDKTEILAVASSGRSLSFPGKSQGSIGHYVASVYFPAGGTYTWQVTQGPFAPQDLGSLTVLGTAASTADKDKTAATDKTMASDKAAAAEKAAAADKAAAAAKAEQAAAAGKTVTVGGTPTSATPAIPASDPIRNALPFAAAAAAAMFLWRLVSTLRTIRRTRATT
jgi:hypothetical protein